MLCVRTVTPVRAAPPGGGLPAGGAVTGTRGASAYVAPGREQRTPRRGVRGAFVAGRRPAGTTFAPAAAKGGKMAAAAGGQRVSAAAGPCGPFYSLQCTSACRRPPCDRWQLDGRRSRGRSGRSAQNRTRSLVLNPSGDVRSHQTRRTTTRDCLSLASPFRRKTLGRPAPSAHG